MTKQLHPLPLRRWVGRGVVLVAATVVLALSAGTGAHAGDAGPLGDVTEGLGGAIQPVVQSAVEAVQSAVPQPVQEAVEPAVENVVEPAASDVEQAVTSLPGAGKAAEPAVKVVEPVVRPADDRADGGDGRGAGGRAGEPVEQPAGEPATGTVDPVDGPAQTPAAAQASASSGQADSNAVGGSGDGAAAGPASTGPTRVGQPPSRAGLCDELPPRPMAVSAIVQHPDELDADQELWNLTNALMHSWIDGDVPGSVDVGPPSDEDGDAWALGPLGGEETDLRAPGRWGTVEVLKLIGLFGLLGLLAAGLAVVVARQTE
ncbi:hypothetical protein IEZ26_13335 [Nocardioides cavernae]|uniref:Uncharacterized protein n=1 Tax=Nocardioides cavernae TaxID=1921566 RepID=A0ABR8NBU0_9ACTN|nr:hypothetical protein [Nocardioides cavernae]MBD3925613.1 hypothetical protein [Nocardioides cavernae]MBM7514007.1 hypothetical protein [Nocardioides cavernae]